ncbi:MAG: arginine repressor [Oscillospiraceae bacterium]|nr:arginine repressor [Oscillospiraceae bacterium]
MKSKRHAKIIEIIGKHDVDTQEELLKYLRNEGFDVTQATVSRDIKELRLVKTAADGGRYRYANAAAREKDADHSYKFHLLLKESAHTVDFAGNIVAIKCYTGLANAVCVTMDSLHWEGMVATLSGDDTIFILMRDADQAARLAEEIRRLMAR